MDSSREGVVEDDRGFEEREVCFHRAELESSWWNDEGSFGVELPKNRIFEESIGNVLLSFFRSRRREKICPERGKFQCHCVPRLMQVVTKSWRFERWKKVQVTHRQDRWKIFVFLQKRMFRIWGAVFFFKFVWTIVESERVQNRFQQKGFCGGWLIFTTNVNKESGASVNQIVIRFQRVELVGADLFVILALQQMWGILRRCLSSGSKIGTSSASEMAWLVSFGFLAAQICWFDTHLERTMCLSAWSTSRPRSSSS